VIYINQLNYIEFVFKNINTMSAFQNSSYGGRGGREQGQRRTGGSASTFGSLTIANLSARDTKLAATDDDVMSTTSYSSIATFQSTYHIKTRMFERSITRKQVGKAIKHGQLIKNSEEVSTSMIVYNDIVVIAAVSRERIIAMRAAEEYAIGQQISFGTTSEGANNRAGTEGINSSWRQQPFAPTPCVVAVTVWRLDNTTSLESEEEYKLHADFMKCIANESDLGGRLSHSSLLRDPQTVESEAIQILLQAESKFPPDRLAAILNFLGVNPELEVVVFTCLHHVAWQGFPLLVEHLLRLGAIPDRKSNSKKKYPPVFYALSSVVPAAVRENPAIRVAVVKLLLPSHSHNIDEMCNGFSLLHKSVFGGHQEIAQILLDKGANPDIRNKYNETPRDLALANGLLLSYRDNNAAAPNVLSGSPEG
jgi:hypothetical protein